MKPTRLSILIVDDWPDAAESLGEALSCYGHMVHVAHDGQEAMAIVRAKKPDVVLLDVAMPVMSGLDLAQVLSEQGDKKPLLIAISGYSTTEDKKAAFKAGFDYFFAKPVEATNILHILEHNENYLFVCKRPMDSCARSLALNH